MKQVLPLAAAAVLIAGLAYLLLGGGDTGTEADYLPDDGTANTAGGEDAMTAKADPSLKADGTGRPPKSRRGPNPMKPYKPRVGVLEVLPLDPDGNPISRDECTVELERVSPAEKLGKLGIRDRETNVWRFNKVPIGPIRVVVTGDHLVEAREVVRVRENSTKFVKIGVEQGALVKYSVEMPDGTVPKALTLSLINNKGRKSNVYWQVREQTKMTSARPATEFKLGPKGVIYGIRPGIYQLKAKTEHYEGTEEVLVGAGDTLEVTVALR